MQGESAGGAGEPGRDVDQVGADGAGGGLRVVMRYTLPERNQLANCMLLSKEENGAGGKGDVLPERWFGDKNDYYLDKHLVPRDPALWKMDRFDDFIRERRHLIRERFKALLVREAVGTS